jgi:hypothetical protein
MLDRPIFFFGVPRSGTSFIYEAFSKHEELGWVSNYQNRLPGIPQISYLNRLFDNKIIYKMGSRKRSTKMTSFKLGFPKPTEPYILWEKLTGVDFGIDFLLGQKASANAIEALNIFHKGILKAQSKSRLVNKFTGPPRIEFIQSVFPNAIFIHIVRDGRGVVQSLLSVDFWKNGGGYEKLWWKNGKESDRLREWSNKLNKPYLLAAYQYRNIMEKTEAESKLLSPKNYLEIRYEDFLEKPESKLKLMYNFCGLTLKSRSFDHLTKSDIDPNKKYNNSFKIEEKVELVRLLEPILLKYNYI